METWSAHHIYQEITQQLGNKTAALVQRYTNQLQSKNLPVIFSLGHIAAITGINYQFLHKSVNRERESANYNMFSIKKRSGGRRFIHAVSNNLLALQKYVNEEILQKVQPHPASFAFHPSGGIKRCAAIHCGCKWLLQFDLKDFFYTISEPKIYKTFLSLGYKPLLAFELTRLCTTLRLPKAMKHYIHKTKCQFECFDDYPYSPQEYIGVLPQGAPTSPMLSNLVSINLDTSLFKYAQSNGFVYSRYADDLAFSASTLPPGKSIAQLKREIISLIRKSGFCENVDKIRIAGPGSKKVILGLLVDNETPRLTKQIRRRVDLYIYSIEKHGIDATATHYNFRSVFGFYNHVSGLMSFVRDVDHKFWDKLNPRFQEIKNSLESKNNYYL